MSLRLDWCSRDAAMHACRAWHYSRTLPNIQAVYIGVWEDERYIGCIVFGAGANANIHRPYGLKRHEVIELTRVALDAHKAPVTRILSIALKMVRKQFPNVRLVISYADADQGHEGTIYRAGNWIYDGFTTNGQQQLIIGSRALHKKSAKTLVRGQSVSLNALRPIYGDAVRWHKPAGKHKFIYWLRRAASIDGDAPAIHVGEGGSTPTAALN